MLWLIVGLHIVNIVHQLPSCNYDWERKQFSLCSSISDLVLTNTEVPEKPRNMDAWPQPKTVAHCKKNPYLVDLVLYCQRSAFESANKQLRYQALTSESSISPSITSDMNATNWLGPDGLSSLRSHSNLLDQIFVWIRSLKHPGGWHLLLSAKQNAAWWRLDLLNLNLNSV